MKPPLRRAPGSLSGASAQSAGRSRTRLAGDDSLHIAAQGRQVLLDHRPDRIEVNIEICVNEAITRPGDLAPRHAGFACSQLGAEILDRFPDDFELAHDSALRLPVGHETIAAFCREAVDGLDRAQHVLQKEPVAIGHSGRASDRMRLFKSGWSSVSVQRSTLTPNASSISNCNPTIRSSDVPGGRSTSKSRSLPSWSSPWATEPNTRTLRAPCAAARANTWLRCEASACEGRIERFWQVSHPPHADEVLE